MGDLDEMRFANEIMDLILQSDPNSHFNLQKRNMLIQFVCQHVDDKNVRLEESKNGNNIVIGPASPADEADYTCQISSYKPSEIVHSVKIRGRRIFKEILTILTSNLYSFSEASYHDLPS